MAPCVDTADVAGEGVIQVTVHVPAASAGGPVAPAAPAAAAPAAPSLTAADPAPTGTPVVATRPAPSSSPLPRTGASVEGLLLVACALLLLGAALVTVVRLRQEQHHA